MCDIRLCEQPECSQKKEYSDDGCADGCETSLVFAAHPIQHLPHALELRIEVTCRFCRHVLQPSREFHLRLEFGDRTDCYAHEPESEPNGAASLPLCDVRRYRCRALLHLENQVETFRIRQQPR